MESPKLFIMVAICWLFKDVNCNSVEQKIYVELNDTVPCVRLLNGTHQIGCQSSISGNVGVIHVLESEANLDWVLSTGPNPPYMVILEASLFTRSVMMRMKNVSRRIAGVAVVTQNTRPSQGFSPHTTCPNENTGVYSDRYGSDLANCNTTVWNPLGNGLSYEEFDFPIFSLMEDNQTEVIKQCYLDHNLGVNGSAPQYPLCAMQLFSHMYAVTDTATCMRRNDINFSLNPEIVCDALQDFNVWGSLRPLNNTAKGHKEGEQVVIAATRLDSRSFFWDVSTGAEGTISGIVTLLAAAHALRNATLPPRNIFYTFFQGETFDYIGSSRMVYDMESEKFVIDLDNIHSILEIGQVGLRDGSLWVHSDPVSRGRNVTVDGEVGLFFNNLQSAASGLKLTVAEPPVSQPLPPSSLQRFLLARPIPGVVLTDHQSAFTNRYYESIYDNAGYLNLTYPSNLTAEEQLEFVTDTAKALGDVATMVARALYKQAGGDDSQLDRINADPTIVTQMLFGFLVQKNNNWFQAVFPPELKSLLSNKPGPPEFYVGVAMPSSSAKTSTRLVQYLLANLTGEAINLTQSLCQSQKLSDDDTNSTDMYSYSWVQGTVPPNGTERDAICVRASVRLHKALSPAFDLGSYSSANYSTWTESRWKKIKARMFLVASHDLEMLTLGVGVAVLVTSLLVTYFVSSKADVLFSSGREPSNAAY
ncbi:nicastrin [Aplochiton taeniatus]